MNNSNNEKPFPYSVGEECLHAISHGVGAALSLVGLVVLLARAYNFGGSIEIAAAAVYGVTLFTLYLFSTLYHSLSRTKASTLFQKFDHIAIYLLIAGTYTPVSLCLIQGSLGWLLFALVWSMAIIGILFKCIYGPKYDLLSTALYVLMGWSIVIAAESFIEKISSTGLALFVLGGISYTLGVYFYIRGERVKWFHGIWHFFVAAGSVWHYFAIFLHVIPS
jgi:hemolysin III